MKNILLTLAVVASLAAFAPAKELHFPEKGDAMFTITIPDSWEPEKDDDNVLEAASPSENVYLMAWELESKKDMKNLGKDLVDLLKDHAKDIKIDGDPVEAKPGGMEGLLFKGHAKDIDDGSKIEFFALLIGHKDRVAVVFIEASEDTDPKESKKLEGILKSLTPAK